MAHDDRHVAKNVDALSTIALVLTDQDIALADRLKRFLETHDYSLVSEEDIDALAEHWKLGVRLAQIDLPEELSFDGWFEGGP